MLQPGEIGFIPSGQQVEIDRLWERRVIWKRLQPVMLIHSSIQLQGSARQVA